MNGVKEMGVESKGINGKKKLDRGDGKRGRCD